MQKRKVELHVSGEMRKLRNTSGEGDFMSVTDADVRKRGDQTGLVSLVVHAVDDEM